MENQPTPIVIVSASPDVKEQMMAFRAVEAGALAVLPSSAGIGHPEYQQTSAELVRTVKLMSEVKVVRRWSRPRTDLVPPPAPVTSSRPVPAGVAVVAIGASTGGPVCLQTIMSQLASTFSAPILVVQHIASGFAQGLADWLGQSSGVPVGVAQHGEIISPGRVYVAPDDCHMKAGPGGHILLSHEPPENGLRPSVSCLFRSVANLYGRRSVGVLLSGMGKDGALELKLMKDYGAVTIAQDQESSIVHGMPGEAIRLGAATYVLPPERIAALLTNLTDGGRKKNNE
jgi:two-component system chemotaxis response regulator CheB